MKRSNAKASDYIGEGSVTLVPEDPEDMWHAYNLITPQDIVRAHAVRKVVTESKTGSTQSERVHIDLAIKVTSTFFDPIAGQLQVSGKVVSENPIVSMGQHHTLDLEIGRPFTISKPEGWDSVAGEALQSALSDDKDGALAAVVMQEGIANICIITQFRTVLRQRVESDVPRKRSASSEQDSGLRRFFDKTLTTLLRSVDFSSPRPLLLAGPGYAPESFKQYIATQGRDKSDKRLTAMAKEAVVIHAPSGHLHSLNEVLKSKEVLAKMGNMKFAKEARLMDQFHERLRADDDRACYGTSAVERAVREGAVGPGGGVLLVNNSLFRSNDLAVRKRYVALVDKVKADGGDVRVLSSEHESGVRLDRFGGIAALLTYPLPDLDDDGGEDDAGDGAENGMVI